MAPSRDCAVDKVIRPQSSIVNRHQGWMGLAETHHHLLPRSTPQDSLALADFERVYRMQRVYVPAIYLILVAVRRVVKL